MFVQGQDAWHQKLKCLQCHKFLPWNSAKLVGAYQKLCQIKRFWYGQETNADNECSGVASSKALVWHTLREIMGFLC